MNLEQVDKIAKAVLYEGYMLYPYRPSSVKNQQRWNFGVLYPKAYSDAQDGTDAWSMQTECIVKGGVDALLEGTVRFLQLQGQGYTVAGQSPSQGCQQATERSVAWGPVNLNRICAGVPTQPFEFPSELETAPDGTNKLLNQTNASARGEIDISARQCAENLFKIRVQVRNSTAMNAAIDGTRDEALQRSLISCHAVLGIDGGEFVSLLEPPAELQEMVSQCENLGAWPVLVGERGERNTLLASPIILYDYPKIAPESPGDLFDGTEIDEILSLRILTLTDDEKREIRHSDERARQILERTEQLPPEQFMKLHGAVRSLRTLKENEL